MEESFALCVMSTIMHHSLVPTGQKNKQECVLSMGIGTVTRDMLRCPDFDSIAAHRDIALAMSPTASGRNDLSH